MVHVRGRSPFGEADHDDVIPRPDPTPVSLIVPVVETPAGQLARTAD